MTLSRRLALLAFTAVLSPLLHAALPVIDHAPEDITANVGGRTGFAVSVASDEPVSYQWFFEDSALSNATQDVLLLTHVQSTAAGAYHVSVTNASGTVTSDMAHLQVSVPQTDLVDPNFNAAVEIDPASPVGFFLFDGSLLVVPADNATETQSALVRLLPDGTIDSTFSFAPSLPAADRIQIDLLQTNVRNEILVGYTTTTARSDGTTDNRFYLSRFTATGAPDETFTTIALDAEISALFQLDGKLIVASVKSLRRFEGDGTPDPTFALTTFQGRGSVDIDLDDDGQVWLGVDYDSYSFPDQLNRLAVDGTLTPHPGPAHFLLRPEGGFIGLDRGTALLGRISTLTLHAYDRYGALDEAFMPNGISWHSSVGESRNVRATVMADGRLVVGDLPSYDLNASLKGPVRRGHLCRLLANGEVDPSFQAVFPDLYYFDSVAVHFYPDKQHALVLIGSRALRVRLFPTGAPPPPRVLQARALTDSVLAGDDYPVSYVAVGPDINAPPSNPFVVHNFQSDSTPSSFRVTSAWGSDEITWIPPVIIETAPRLIETPDSITLSPDRRLTLSADIRGTDPITVEWFKDGEPISAPSAYYSLPAGEGAGTYRIVATNALGTTEHSFTIAFGSASRLSNLSTRGYAGTGDEVMIIGFILKGGAARKEVMLRAVGRELRTDFGLDDVLENPRVTLFDGLGRIIAEGDDTPYLGPNDTRLEELGAFPVNHGPSSLLFSQLKPGAYTLHITPATGAPGIVLGEIYDADDLADRLINVSTRALVKPGNALAISGFVVAGDAPKRLLIRGIGPTLQNFGVSNALADPVLQVFNAAGEVIATNDDWINAPDQDALRATTTALAFPLDAEAADAALILEVPPGTYTAQIRGKDDTTGIALIEIYEVP